MNRLFVEELESRNLLNAGAFGHESLLGLRQDRIDAPTLMRSSTVDPELGFSARVEREFGSVSGRAGPESGIDSFRPVRAIGANPNTISVVPEFTIIFILPNSASGVESNSDSAASVSVPASVAVPDRAFDLANSSVDPNSIQPTQRTQNNLTIELVPAANLVIQVANPVSAKAANNFTDVAVLSTAMNGSSTNALTAEALAIALSAKANVSLAHADSLAGTTNVRAVPSGLAADVAAARGGSEIGADLALPRERPQAAQPIPQSSMLTLPQAPSAKAIRAGLGSLPQLADLMNGFSAVELTRIEQGITNFLDRLDGKPGLAVSQGEADLYPWIIAGVTTLAACEMARRQLKRASARSTADFFALSMIPWNAPHERNNG